MSGYVPVRLCDVPLHVREAAARREARKESDSRAIVDLLRAALEPSDTTYWLPAEVKPMVDVLTRNLAT